MKSMVQLTCCLLREVEAQTGISTVRDEITIKSRTEKEGESFLTITLPQFGKDLLVALDEGAVRPGLFNGFYRKKGTELPAFMGGFFSWLFFDDGELRLSVSNPNIRDAYKHQDAKVIRYMRQILLLHSKVELDCTPKRVQAALDTYVATDNQIKVIPQDDIADFRETAQWIFGTYFLDIENHIKEIIPRHSSGALATRESYNERFSSRIWTERLQEVFPFWDYLLSTSTEVNELDDPVQILDLAAETPSKVTTVPKTLKGPRIIAMEPVYNQMVQQGILHLLTSTLRKYPDLWYGCCWEYQDFNRLLSQIGSETRKLATIDLSEASDRVSGQLVFQGLLAPWQALSLNQAIRASRSEKANVNGVTLDLKKFASMGSSLTFPMETFVFYTIIHMAWRETYGAYPPKALTPEDGVRVYGDDLIVPVELVPSLVRLLETYGLKVNDAKSFWTGKFRESCGADWYDGESVSPIRLRHPLPSKRSHVDGIESGIQFHNRLYEAGYWDTAAVVAKELRSLMFIPAVPVGSNLLGLMTIDLETVEVRFSPTLHRSEIKALVARRQKPKDKLDGYGALSKFFIPHAEREVDHLERDGRSHCVGLHMGWLPVA